MSRKPKRLYWLLLGLMTGIGVINLILTVISKILNPAIDASGSVAVSLACLAVVLGLIDGDWLRSHGHRLRDLEAANRKLAHQARVHSQQLLYLINQMPDRAGPRFYDYTVHPGPDPEDDHPEDVTPDAPRALPNPETR